MNNIKLYSSIALTTLLLLTGCSQTSTHHTEEAQAETHHAKHWGYTGDVGPSHWSELNEKFNMCSQGKMQTPINIVPTSDIDLPALDLEYTTGSESIIDNGHTVQVNIKDGSVLKLGGLDYKLKQFHFHTPSENNIKSKSFPLEAHFVHATDDGKLAVVAVMFEEGAENPTLAKIWKKLPKLKRGTEAKCGLTSDEVKSLMPTNKDYYKFIGSLTTPPCSENVKWQVFKTPLTVSKEQAAQFTALFGHPNNRPIQDTNNRVIED
jgi:carbonic anhydrase